VGNFTVVYCGGDYYTDARSAQPDNYRFAGDFGVPTRGRNGISGNWQGTQAR
jgi:hypothetical protein